ncbi:hypothetical protein EMCRGX_G030099 [Ephydatia muelleri]
MTLYTTVNCNDGDVRLVGGTSPLNGRVQVCYHNQWGGVCSPRCYFRSYEAAVVCQQLGYNDKDASGYSSSRYSANTATFLIVDHCDYNGNQLLDCYSSGSIHSTLGYYTCTGCSDLVVNCTKPIPEYCSGTCTNGSIRLVGGPSPNEGRLEVCFEGCWGTVCDTHFEVSNAFVAYHQLGFSPFAPTSTCSNGDVRLVNGSTPLEGRVEVCIGQQWGAVCGDYQWTRDTSGANTVCEQLGYSSSNATGYVYSCDGSYTGGIVMVNVQCDARAGRLVDCRNGYMHLSRSLGSSCYRQCTAGQYPLVYAPMEWYVWWEAPPLMREEWKYVLMELGEQCVLILYIGDFPSASVVCGQLGYKAAGVLEYDAGTGPVWLRNLKCTGLEQRLLDCPVINFDIKYYAN